MTCPYCGGEMERGYIHKGGYIAWNPEERDLGLPEREKGGFYAEKNLLGMAAPVALLPGVQHLRLLPLEAAGGRVTALLAFAYSRAL